ncbi:hypothetical protein NOF55_10780 [Rhizobiaceae bacterium BDR2-2]|uniref:Short C-terminal domain-containing protein n=1 Tax=Ectorhizobium quercum TaxID=2965071 RepID=A0AAE3N0F1_9HYPH|nr:hypothetical protein [Ectorhizobium quercum]MCX8997591.1 hypothetical protein [Ectorhizobium quercum]
MKPVGNLALAVRAAAVAAICAAAAGCASNNVGTESGPMATPQVVTVVPGVPSGPAPTGPQKTGYYPGFAEPLTSAALQMTNEEAATQQQQLSALGAARRRGAISEAEYRRRQEELRRLATQHGEDTLNQITN